MITVKLALDTTAVQAFANASIHVGELLAELEDEDTSFAISALCLAEASATIGDESMIRLLVQRAACLVIPVRRDDWPALARELHKASGLSMAATALIAERADAYIVTADPDGYGKDAPVIPI